MLAGAHGKRQGDIEVCGHECVQILYSKYPMNLTYVESPDSHEIEEHLKCNV